MSVVDVELVITSVEQELSHMTNKRSIPLGLPVVTARSLNYSVKMEWPVDRPTPTVGDRLTLRIDDETKP